jgi:DNA-directed RNA polymerase specialized sigma24 family protein
MENEVIRNKIINNYLTNSEIQDILFKYALKFQNNNYNNAKELLQRTYIRIDELSYRLDTYIYNIDKFKSWSFLIMRYLSSNLNRENYRKTKLVNYNIRKRAKFTDLNNNIIDLSDNPELQLINKERNKSIETIKAIIINSKNLSNYTKTALIERMNGTSINEIAKKLGKNTNNTKTYIYTEIKRMPEYLTIRKIYEQNII